MPKVARITTQPGGRPALLIVDSGAALGLSLARAVRRYGCDAAIATSVPHAMAALAHQTPHLLIVHDTQSISPEQLEVLRRGTRRMLPCVVLGREGSALVTGDVRLVQTPVETSDVMRAIKASLGLAPGRRRTPTYGRIRRISSFSIPVVHGEFSMSEVPCSPQRRSDAPEPHVTDTQGGYSVQNRARETLRLMPAMP